MAAPVSGYPPAVHIARDLRFVIERDDRGTTSLLPVSAWICGPGGAVRAGALAMLCDMAGGEGAIRAVQPDWVATSDLVLHVTRAVSGGVVRARPSLLRRTRSTAVIEVALGAADGGPDLGLATLTFAVLPARDGVQRMGTGHDVPRTEFALPGSGLEVSLEHALGARTEDAAGGVVLLPVTPYVGNSLGALQGGVVAMLIELAAEAAGGALLGGAVSVLDLAINYLGLLRVGPARTRARLLRRDEREALLRVELLDAGADERLCSVATVLVRV